MVAAAFGSRLTTKAMGSAVRSCMRRTSSGEKLRRGKITVTRGAGVHRLVGDQLGGAARSVSYGRLVDHVGRLCKALRRISRSGRGPAAVAERDWNAGLPGSLSLTRSG
jgi:hypothetical protein